MLVFDAYPLAAVLLGEPAGRPAGRMLVDAMATGSAMVCATNLAEVVDLVARASGADPSEVLDVVELWLDAGLIVEPLTWPVASAAASLRAMYYHRSSCPVSLADCAAVALAAHGGAQVVTSDRPLADVAAARGVAVLPVADSRGRLPTE